MVIGAFPIAKLGALLLRQLSKPIANYAKERAKNHPFFRKYVCMPPAQFYNWCEIKTKMWLLNLGKPVNIPPLNEAMAIELGANLLGEGILFIVAAAVVIIEYNRQATKQAIKEEKLENDVNRLENKIQDLALQGERQEAQLRELFRYVFELNSKVVKIPWSISQKPEDSDSSETKSDEKKVEELGKGAVTKALHYILKDLFLDTSNEKDKSP